MKAGKKLLALAAGLTLSVSAFMGLAGCGDGVVSDYDTKDIAGTYKITVWTSETKVEDETTHEVVTSVAKLTESQIAKFNETNKFGINIEATIEGVGEGEAATQMVSSVEDGADLFFFAQDQTMRLMQAGALSKLGNATTADVKKRNDASAISAATVGDSLYCYPLTSDNGYYMYYNKSVIPENHLDSLEDIIADCEDAGQNISYNLEGSGWYSAGFFFATGCHSTWTTDDDGNFTSVSDDFNSDKGVIALRGMQKVLQSKAYVDSQSTADFAAAIPSAVVISGTWDSVTAKNALGENYGVTDLPSFTVDGKSYHLGSYSGNKLLGMKPQTDNKKAAAIQQLALFLTNDDCQLERFNTFGWGPSNTEAQNDKAVKADPALAALAKQNEYAVPQGQIPGKWWDIAKVYASSAKAADANDTTALKATLKVYEDSIKAVVDGSEDETAKNALTVIGNMYGDNNWTKDIPMTEKSGAWYSVPVLFEENAEFKVRKGAAWDWSTGNVIEGATGYETLEGGNAKVTTAGLYIVKYTDAGIELIPATLGVVGKVNGVDSWDTDIAMTKVEGENAYITDAVTFAAGDAIKVRFNATWDMGDIGDNGDNFAVAEAGSKKVKLTWDATNVTWTISLVD